MSVRGGGTSGSRLAWYGRRFSQMGPGEVGWRIADRLNQERWSLRCDGGTPDRPHGTPGSAHRAHHVPRLAPGADLSQMGAEREQAILTAAERLLGGTAQFLGVPRDDMADPTWAFDPISGHAYPSHWPAHRIDYRGEGDPRNIKQVWELSRLQHLTLLSCAWRLTGDDRYATMVARHLHSWLTRNPVGRGVNWSSGIEIGIRLISFAWVRRLLDSWDGAPALFECNDTFAGQLYWHQRFLSTFRSRGSSANNHVIAEAAGQLVASCAFPWFSESAGWRAQSARLLASELERNTFPDGVNREQAFDYHGFVCELGLVAAAEADAAGAPLGSRVWERLCQMVDVVAATLDATGGAPRYGDGDDGRALVVTAPDDNRWLSLLALGEALFGRRPWWPDTAPDAQSIVVGTLVGRLVPVEGRPVLRPSSFPAAGLTILRSNSKEKEIWCRCDGGPHGFLSIAAHAHADALGIEVRHQGVELLCDPGTYCYHGHPAWRSYFRSTIAHNTIELDGQDQSLSGGPFLWTRKTSAKTLDVALPAEGEQVWSAEHTGYERLDPPVTHRRSVTLDATALTLEVRDEIASAGLHRVRLAFHLGPSVDAAVDGDGAALRWCDPEGRSRAAILALPAALTWRAYRGSADPVLGWYSPRFGEKVPTTTLIGAGSAASAVFLTRLQVAQDPRQRVPTCGHRGNATTTVWVGDHSEAAVPQGR